MLTTTLDTAAIRTNIGTTAIVAILPSGREVLLGESAAQGAKRAKIEVFSGIADPLVGTGAALTALERQIRRLEIEAGHRSV
jgi:hypothetical protein